MRQTILSGCLLAVWAALTNGAPARGDERPLRATIDAEIRAAWQREKITPAGRADAAAFLRRIYLDLAGTIPTYEEALQFLKDDSADKRAKLIDKLLDDPRFGRHQAEVWEQVLLGRRPINNPEPPRVAFRSWFSERINKNEPYDHLVRDLLRAEGSSLDSAGPIFYAQFQGRPEETAMAVSRIFLATQIHCAQCHDDRRDHKWTQLDFYGFSAFFARLTVVNRAVNGKAAQEIGEKSRGEMMFVGPAAKQEAGKQGKPVPPKFLDGAVLDEPPVPTGFKEPQPKEGQALPKPGFSRKEKLADWAASADNPFFARAAVNRLWAQLMGRGLVHPVDDLRDKRAASHPQLLQALAEQFVAHGFDTKWLLREIANSEAYQLASASAVSDPQWFERTRFRALTPEELLNALREASGYDASVRATGKDPAKASLPAALDFWFPYSVTDAPAPGGDYQASLKERLFMNNGTRIRELLQARKGNLADWLTTTAAPIEERVDRLYLSVLTRLPKTEERRLLAEHLNADPQKRGALAEEAIWALVNCSEFRFNH
jgi:hypothetical protein